MGIIPVTDDALLCLITVSQPIAINLVVIAY